MASTTDDRHARAIEVIRDCYPRLLPRIEPNSLTILMAFRAQVAAKTVTVNIVSSLFWHYNWQPTVPAILCSLQYPSSGGQPAVVVVPCMFW